MIGQTFGNMRNKICLELLQNQNIIKALIVDDKENLHLFHLRNPLF